MTEAILEVNGLVKNYGGLRPLRLQQLTVQPGEQVALVGFDQPTAEVFINLLTGATLPEQGRVTLFGRSTADIEDSTDWLSIVDRFGIVSERAPLLESMSVLQNLAMPFSIEIDPISDDLRKQASALAQRTGLSGVLDQRIGDLDASTRLLARLARALALDPAIVLFEHPSATLERGQGARVAGDLRRVLLGHRAGNDAPPATLTLTADRDFAAAIGSRVLALDPVSGRLSDQRRGWFFGRGPASL